MSVARPGPDIDCPECGVASGLRCRSLTTNRSTDTHVARWEAWYERTQRRRKEAMGQVVLAPVPEVCACGNRFDGDNLCMISACEQET